MAANTPPPAATSPPPGAGAPTDTPRPVEIGAPDPGTALPDGRIQVGGQAYDAYIPAVLKTHQDYHYTCEFDAAWVVLKTYGFDATLPDMLNIVGVDTSREPTWEDTPQGAKITGGDILHFYSGNYVTNFLARTTGPAMRKLFAHFGLSATPVHTQAAIEAALRGGSLVWIKTTADFLPGRLATWILPDGTTYQTVLGNDHAAVIMGYNADGVLIRDVLGPTATNMQRLYQYPIAWPRFLRIWASQSNDGLAVAPPGHR